MKTLVSHPLRIAVVTLTASVCAACGLSATAPDPDPHSVGGTSGRLTVATATITDTSTSTDTGTGTGTNTGTDTDAGADASLVPDLASIAPYCPNCIGALRQCIDQQEADYYACLSACYWPPPLRPWPYPSPWPWCWYCQDQFEQGIDQCLANYDACCL